MEFSSLSIGAIDFKSASKKKETALKNKIVKLESELKGMKFIKDNVTKILTKCKVPQKDINQLFKPIK